ncbi:BglG family transcription antiterminator [Virgibacillus sp. 179-BFC.A HS]|uniref:BglG family transcription antiterminator n=1 Tax=Tigheibacillus jepli TaxID=3035914 RepID=A0ABU5CJZ8_9BACI|nr:BglG family transcription antiterminator [Virgibacillus sp. 179-BFC.A HS]MDY0406139.1 BglG family transcription antiterminator [Virgibacillus sp. 179-BFC.A HS]
MSTLLEADGPVKLFTLANELHVTIATISNDLDQLDAELRPHQLFVNRKRGYGVEIAGNEADKRAAITSMISRFLSPFDYVAMVKENIQHKKTVQPSDTISNRLLGLVDPEKLQEIEDLVRSAKKQLPHDLADSAYVGLVVHLALAMERLQKGDTITFDRDYLQQLENTKEYSIAAKMIRELEKSYQMKIPDDEIGYITMHLLGAKLRNSEDYFLEDASLDVALKAKELIGFVSDYMDLDLTGNNQLLNDLVAHLKPAMYRLERGMNIKNPMTAEIKKNYDDFFELIVQGVQKVFPRMDFPDDEIAYLVLHFASVILYGEFETGLNVLVLCSTGIGSAKMLATRLKQRIPEIKHVDNKSMFEDWKKDIDQYDLVLSTIPLNDFDDYILVSPMLQKEEAHRIKKAIRKQRVTKPLSKKQDEKTPRPAGQYMRLLKEKQMTLSTVMDILTYFKNDQIDGESVQSILWQLCNKLHENARIANPQAVLKKLLDREQIGGLGIPDTSMALYHMRSDDVQHPTFIVASLQQKITVKAMDGSKVGMRRVLLLLAPQNASRQTLEAVSFLSGTIVKNKASIKLFETGSEDEIKQFLAKQFYEYVQNK